MAIARPVADITTGGWRTEGCAVSNLFASLNAASESPEALVETLLGRKRMIVVMTDDKRRTDLQAMPETVAWLSDDEGFEAPLHVSDRPVCTPSRAQIDTGYQSLTHNQTQEDPATYYRLAVQGRTISGDPYGPWEKHTGDTSTSGDLMTALRTSGIGTARLGKYTHGYGRAVLAAGVDYRLLNEAGDPLDGGFPWSTTRTPPNVEYCFLRVGPDNCVAGSASNWDGGDPDPYGAWITEKLESVVVADNTDGVGAPALYIYDQDITAGSIDGTTATIGIDEHGMADGDVMVVGGCTPSGYNTGTTEVAVTVVDPDSVSYTVTGTPPGGAMSSLGTAYIEKYHGTTILFDRLMAYIERQADDASFFAFVSPNAPHSSGSPRPHKAFEGQVVDPEDFHYYGGVAGEIAPTVDDEHTLFNGARTAFVQRWESLAHLDREMKRLKDFLAARGDDDTAIIFISDQGAMHGEHDLYRDNGNNYFVKHMAYEPAAGSPFLARNVPGLTHGDTLDGRSVHFDLMPTILDFFGLHEHAYISTRDGVSLIRKHRANIYPDRAVNMVHKQPDGGNVAQALIDGDYKWIDALPGSVYVKLQDEQLYNTATDPDEATNLLVSDPTTYQPIADAMRARSTTMGTARGDDYREA